jgi:hypothetical protein
MTKPIVAFRNFAEARDEWHTSYYQKRSGLRLSQHCCWKFSAARDVSLPLRCDKFPTLRPFLVGVGAWMWNSLRNVGKHAHGNSATSQKCRHFLMMTFRSCWRCCISLCAEQPLVKWTADNK